MDAILETTLDIFKGWLQSFTLRWPGSVEELSDGSARHGANGIGLSKSSRAVPGTSKPIQPPNHNQPPNEDNV